MTYGIALSFLLHPEPDPLAVCRHGDNQTHTQTEGLGDKGTQTQPEGPGFQSNTDTNHNSSGIEDSAGVDGCHGNGQETTTLSIDAPQPPEARPGTESFARVTRKTYRTKYQNLIRFEFAMVDKLEGRDAEMNESDGQLDDEEQQCYIALGRSGSLKILSTSKNLVDAVTGNHVNQQHLLMLSLGRVTIEIDVDYEPGQRDGQVLLKMTSELDTKEKIIYVNTWNRFIPHLFRTFHDRIELLKRHQIHASFISKLV